MHDFTKINCWVVTEGIAGTENQCIGVAEALGVKPEIKRIQLKQPWKMLSPYLGAERASTFNPALTAPWPDLLIASGRKSIGASRYIKRMSNGKTFTVQIQDPRVSTDQFDLVAVPAHDPTRGENVIVTTAAPNRITQDRLEVAWHKFPKFQSFKPPRVAVLIGGNSKAYKMTPEITQDLANKLQKLYASLMITTSRRTGVENTEILRKALGDKHYFWNGKDKNPYFGMLAAADIIMVTADSASMLSEACTTGKPVYMIPLDGGHERIDKLHENLRQSRALRNFNGKLMSWEYEPLNDAQIVADEIRKRMDYE